MLAGLWYAAVVRRRPPFDPADPRLVARSAAGWELRPHGRDAVINSLGLLAAVSFVSVFGLAFGVGTDPPRGPVGGGYAVVAVGGVWAARRRARKPAVVSDEIAGTLTFGGWR